MKWMLKKDRPGMMILENGWEGVITISAAAKAADGRQVDSLTAELAEKAELPGGGLRCVFRDENGLVLTELLETGEEGAVVSCSLSDASGTEVETNYLQPAVFQGCEEDPLPVWPSLWTTMVLVPYDNTMWVRYEAVPLRFGRVSSDYTLLSAPDCRESLLIGALDFHVWKNGLRCSGTGARSVECCCGLAGEFTHDSEPHGTVKGTKVDSSRFLISVGEDRERLLTAYGDRIKREQKPLSWENGVPFGYNSWSALAVDIDERHFRHTADILHRELRPLGYEDHGVNYTNLDAGWQKIPEKDLIRMAEDLHARGQKAGIYDAPFAFFGRDVKAEIPGLPGRVFEEILQRDHRGELMRRVDNAIPFDVTHPLWREYTHLKFQQFIRWGYDYLKVDFMTHGGMEGAHYDPAVRTGRQAIGIGYRAVAEELSEKNAGRPFFISLSIAPLFPCGFGHSRRFSCDAFGTAADVEYVLNAQSYAWWHNGRLYQFNDPDHICLLKSFGMKEDSTEGEARARFTSAVITGGVMMVSDDYFRPEAKERLLKLAGVPEINRIAASGVSFWPVGFAGTSACSVFRAQIEGKEYLAMFHWKPEVEETAVPVEGESWKNLWDGRVLTASDGVLRWRVGGCDALLLEREEPQN